MCRMTLKEFNHKLEQLNQQFTGVKDNYNGYKEWFVNGKRHLDDDLPAIEWINGGKDWYVNGKLHREGDRPAVEWFNGDKYWYKNGDLHREGGLPAIEGANGYKAWWLNGRILSEDQAIAYTSFCKKIKEKNAQKKIYFWWIPICYDMSRECGKRMAHRNIISYQKMMK